MLQCIPPIPFFSNFSRVPPQKVAWAFLRYQRWPHAPLSPFLNVDLLASTWPPLMCYQYLTLVVYGAFLVPSASPCVARHPSAPPGLPPSDGYTLRMSAVVQLPSALISICLFPNPILRPVHVEHPELGTSPSSDHQMGSGVHPMTGVDRAPRHPSVVSLQSRSEGTEC